MCIFDGSIDVMSLVRALVALIAALAKKYESGKFLNPQETQATCAKLREWSIAIQRENNVCVLDASMIDKILGDFGRVLVSSDKWMCIQLDNTVDAIFAKGNTIVAIVYLHELSVDVKKVDGALKDVLQKIGSIEKQLEATSNDVVDYLSLRHINLIASSQLMQLREEIAKLSQSAATIPELSSQFLELSVHLCKIQQRLALDVS